MTTPTKQPPSTWSRVPDFWKTVLLVGGIFSIGFGCGTSVTNFLSAPAQNTKRIESLEERDAQQEATQTAIQGQLDRQARELKLMNCNLRALRNPAFDFAACTSEIQ